MNDFSIIADATSPANPDLPSPPSTPTQSMDSSSANQGLTITEATVKYNTLPAVNNVSLHVDQGEVLALLGPSGCGKSSLLRAIMGLETLAQGTISWQGKDLRCVPVHKRGFGLMFQDGLLFHNRTVARNVGYALEFGEHKQSRAQRSKTVGELLKMVGLEGYEKRAVYTLSGGQAQRVALARLLAPSPKLLLLDEPMAALDRAWREQLVGELRRIIRERHLTALYVTHDQDEAFNLADKIAVMDQGRILTCQSAHTLYSHPTSEKVARFLGYECFLDSNQARAFGLQLPADEELGLGESALKIMGVGLVPLSCGEGQNVSGKNDLRIQNEGMGQDLSTTCIARVIRSRVYKGLVKAHVVWGEDGLAQEGEASAPVEKVGLVRPGQWVQIALDPDCCCRVPVR